MKETVKKAVIYARYSSHNQREESIEQQVEECMNFARANKYSVIQIYADKAVSGKTEKRTQFQKMLKDAEKREFTTVIAYKSNRIARNMLNALTTEEKLSKLGIETFYCKEEFGNSAAGRFALRTMMNVNQFYSENLAEDVKRGMRDNAENCMVNGQVCYGYKKGDDGKYAINEKEADIVREIFTKALNGVSNAEIARDLNDRGYRTRRGNQWNKGSFHKLLQNDTYIGVYHHSGVTIENGVPAIIDKSVFQAVSAMQDKKKYVKGRHTENGDYLLTGKLFCGLCGSPMVGVSGKTRENKPNYYYYVCKNRREKHECEKKPVPRDQIERTVVQLTKDYVLKDDVIEWIAENTVQFQKDAIAESDLPALQSELAENKKAQKNMLNAIEAGIITASTKDRLLEIEANISELEQCIAVEKASHVVLDKEHILFMLHKLVAGDVDDQKYRKMIIDTFVRRVYLYDGKIKIEYWHSDAKGCYSGNLDDFGNDFEPGDDSPYCVELAPPKESYTDFARLFITSHGFVLLANQNTGG